MFNYKFTLEYNGADFFGSQRQDKHRTVQGELESALSKFLKVDIESNFAGRTDAGVHAIGQVVNFKIPFPLPFSFYHYNMIHVFDDGTSLALCYI